MIPDVIVPTLLIDPQKAHANIQRMVNKAHDLNLTLRPHFKTHQSAEIGQWFREAGVQKITVSSLRMATYFADAGWANITIAFPVNILEINRINDLAKRIQLNLLVENQESIHFLQEKLENDVHLFLALNAGNNRTGLHPSQIELAKALVGQIGQSNKTQFAGVLAHAGHTYQARGKEEIVRIHQASLDALAPAVEALRKESPDLIFSYGDTPSASVAENFPDVDELRPGNFVFYDLTQATIGSCHLEDIAVAMACPVVSKHPDRGEVVLYGGGIHFSKDYLERNGQTTYGLPVKWAKTGGWTVIDDGTSHLRKISQEHGLLRLSQEWFDQVNIGDVVGVVPVHSCMTADLMKAYQSTVEDITYSMMTYG